MDTDHVMDPGWFPELVRERPLEAMLGRPSRRIRSRAWRLVRRLLAAVALMWLCYGLVRGLLQVLH